MGNLTTIGHVSRGIDFFRGRTSIWLGLGRNTPWPNEDVPPSINLNATTVDGIFGMLLVNSISMVQPNVNGNITITGKQYSKLSDSEALSTLSTTAITNETLVTVSTSVLDVGVPALANGHVVPGTVVITATDTTGTTFSIVDTGSGSLVDNLTSPSSINYINYTTGVFANSGNNTGKITLHRALQANTSVIANYSYNPQPNLLYARFILDAGDFIGYDYRQYGIFLDAEPLTGFTHRTAIGPERFKSLGKLVYLTNTKVQSRYSNTRHSIEILITE